MKEYTLHDIGLLGMISSISRNQGVLGSLGRGREHLAGGLHQLSTAHGGCHARSSHISSYMVYARALEEVLRRFPVHAYAMYRYLQGQFDWASAALSHGFELFLTAEVPNHLCTKEP